MPLTEGKEGLQNIFPLEHSCDLDAFLTVFAHLKFCGYPQLFLVRASCSRSGCTKMYALLQQIPLYFIYSCDSGVLDLPPLRQTAHTMLNEKFTFTKHHSKLHIDILKSVSSRNGFPSFLKHLPLLKNQSLLCYFSMSGGFYCFAFLNKTSLFSKHNSKGII